MASGCDASGGSPCAESFRSPYSTRASDRPDGRCRNVEPRDRAEPVSLAPHHRLPPLPSVSEARHHFAQPVARGARNRGDDRLSGGTWGHRLRYARSGSQANSSDDQHQPEEDEPEPEEDRQEEERRDRENHHHPAGDDAEDARDRDPRPPPNLRMSDGKEELDDTKCNPVEADKSRQHQQCQAHMT